MYLLEAVFVVATMGLLVALIVPRIPNSAARLLFAIGLLAALSALALGQARIHMVPAALLFLILSLLLLKRGYSHVVIRAAGLVLGLVLIGTSATLTLALPVVALPAPEGPYAVGVTSFNLVDDSRDEAAFGAPGTPREIYVQVWYPGTLSEEGPEVRARSLWQELYRPSVMKLFLGYLSEIETHSYEELPLSSERDVFPAIVFSPSLSGIAEQNTLLMEHLASHGYIVFGITHPYFGIVTMYSDDRGVPASPDVMEAASQQGDVDLDALAQRAEQASMPIEAARVWLEYFEQGTMLTEFTDIWVRDLRVLVDAITEPGESRIAAVERIDSDRIGFIGMSYGGGAVTEFCKGDARCRAAVNLDGGLWGVRMLEPLQVPYLALASPGNARFFEYGRLTSQAPYYALTVQGAMHTNFMDVSLFVPGLKWLGVTGPIEGERVIRIMNDVVQRFFDGYLRDDAAPAFDSDEFPEIEVKANIPARPGAERN